MFNPNHKCNICVSPEALEVEKKYSKGWRVEDIQKTHKNLGSRKVFHIHISESGLEEKYQKKREIHVDQVCDEIIRAGLPLLESRKGLYVRDIIDALKVKARLEHKDVIEELWKTILEAPKETSGDKTALNNSFKRVLKIEKSLTAEIKSEDIKEKEEIIDTGNPVNRIEALDGSRGTEASTDQRTE